MEGRLYELEYKKNKHFSFGKNWQDFLKSLNEERIERAKKSLVEFVGGEEKVKGKTFVDIGCGSGMFSLAAFELGASKIVSCDVDDFSIACVRYLKEKRGKPENWEIWKGSALDESFIKSLGKFDIVYSWGALHHTGDMYKALNGVVKLIGDSGVLYLAIYNKFNFKFKGGTSNFWLEIKKFYNKSGNFVKSMMVFNYSIYLFLMMLLRFQNPIKQIKKYKKERGMNWRNDVIDWLGGYPYEFASPEELINYFGDKDIFCKKLIHRNGTGCNEYLFIK